MSEVTGFFFLFFFSFFFFFIFHALLHLIVALIFKGLRLKDEEKDFFIILNHRMLLFCSTLNFPKVVKCNFKQH